MPMSDTYVNASIVFRPVTFWRQALKDLDEFERRAGLSRTIGLAKAMFGKLNPVEDEQRAAMMRLFARQAGDAWALDAAHAEPYVRENRGRVLYHWTRELDDVVTALQSPLLERVLREGAGEFVRTVILVCDAKEKLIGYAKRLSPSDVDIARELALARWTVEAEKISLDVGRQTADLRVAAGKPPTPESAERAQP